MTSRVASFRLTVLAGALTLPAALAFGGCSNSLLDDDAAGTGGAFGTGGDGLGTGGAVLGTGGDVAGVGGAITGAGGTTGTGGGSYETSLGAGVQAGNGTTPDRSKKVEVQRDGISYQFIANGWGTKWVSHSISYLGTSFNVAAFSGSQGDDYSPAGYPTTFCGIYSDSASATGASWCGLPAAFSELTTLKTGWRWAANGNNGQYNAAYDIWIGTGTTINTHSSFLMVWLRDPSGQQPAGGNGNQPNFTGISVPGVAGTWNVWNGSVNNKPIVNYVRPEGQDLAELEFDAMNFYNHAKSAGYNLPGTHVLSVAVGFEIWNGPATNLESVDFYVDVN